MTVIGKSAKNTEHIRYKGARWIDAELPQKNRGWLQVKKGSVAKDLFHRRSAEKEISFLICSQPWKWPKRPHYFFSDMHADTDAFIASLVASGGIKKDGPKDKDFDLSKEGRNAVFVIGGDCFDKGPSTIRLLRAIRRLVDKQAKVKLLAGNHDVRTMLGIRAVDVPRNPRTDHFFIRMGPKVIPFLKEVYLRYLQDKRSLQGIPDIRECRRRLYPSKQWFKLFPRHAGWVMPDAEIEREMVRLKVKMDNFEENCAVEGLTLRMVYAAVKKWQQLFLHPKGEFYWFFDKMKLAYRSGSFLFIHAGLDDRTARIINQHGVDYLNQEFHRQLRGDLFDFYYSSMANTLRTKYREVDRPLTRHGVEDVRNRGIYSIVHGHKNLMQGQRIMLRKGLVNFECDTTVNRASRKREGLQGSGAAATVIRPSKVVLGVSTDCPQVKVFDYRSISNEIFS